MNIFNFFATTKALKDQREKFDKEMEEKKKDLSEEQLKLLVDEHRQQAEFLERNMDAEKNRQTSTIADKIAEKKRKRALALAKRHEADNKNQLADERKERNELLDGQVCLIFLFFFYLIFFLFVSLT